MAVMNIPASSFYLFQKELYPTLYDQVLLIPFVAVAAAAAAVLVADVLVDAVLAAHEESLQENVHLWNFSAWLGCQYHQCPLKSVCYHRSESSDSVVTEVSEHQSLQMKQFSFHDDDVLAC